MICFFYSNDLHRDETRSQMAMIEKKGKFELRLRPSRANYIGAVLSLIGFVLTLLCLVGSRHPSGKSLHFIKLTDNPPGSLALYVGWQGYCVDDQGSTECHTDDGVMQAPFGTLQNGNRGCELISRLTTT